MRSYRVSMKTRFTKTKTKKEKKDQHMGGSQMLEKERDGMSLAFREDGRKHALNGGAVGRRAGNSDDEGVLKQLGNRTPGGTLYKACLSCFLLWSLFRASGHEPSIVHGIFSMVYSIRIMNMINGLRVRGVVTEGGRESAPGQCSCLITTQLGRGMTAVWIKLLLICLAAVYGSMVCYVETKSERNLS